MAAATISARSVAAFWQQMTEEVLRCYLHAAALSGATMRDVLGWVARPADPTPIRILRTTPEAAPGWPEELTAQSGADPRQRDSVWAGVRRAVDALADPRVLDACSPPPHEAFDAGAFLRARGTLYLLGTTGAQLSVAPLITALVEDLVDAARRLAADQPGGRLDPPLTLLLDEAANIARSPACRTCCPTAAVRASPRCACCSRSPRPAPDGVRPGPMPCGTRRPRRSSSVGWPTPMT
jgi:type IV secretion system protein VirD4